MKNIKIEIKNRWTGSVLFEYESENNTIKKTLREAVKSGANLRGANLEGANLEGANLEGANLEGANLRGVDLRGANLRGANLEGVDLEGANLRGANLEGANLRGANLEGANLEGANLRGANLRGADLEGANLRGANLEGVDLEGADLEGVDLRGANLRGAYLYVSDDDIDVEKIIKNFEEKTNLKIVETYINHGIYPTKWNFLWENGLIIRKYKENPKPQVKRMTHKEICEALGYDVEIIKGEENE